MQKLTLSTLFLLLISGNAQADIYKCIVAGKTTFSQSPCAVDAEKIEVKIHKPSEEAVEQRQSSNQFYADEAKLRKIKLLERNNSSLRNDIKSYEKDLDTEMEIIRLKKSTAANNLAGATWEQALSEEMSAVTEKYRLKIERVNAKIDQNNQKIEELESGDE